MSSEITWGTLGAITFVCLIGGSLYGCPQYTVYQQGQAGQAELAKADFSERIAVRTAQANLDSAKLQAQTDVIRAQGVANANKILADSLGGPEGYLRWKYIEMLETTADSVSRQVIYIPTEAGLPILESHRLDSPSGAPK